MEMLKTVCADTGRGGGDHLIYFILTDKTSKHTLSLVSIKPISTTTMTICGSEQSD